MTHQYARFKHPDTQVQVVATFYGGHVTLEAEPLHLSDFPRSGERKGYDDKTYNEYVHKTLPQAQTWCEIHSCYVGTLDAAVAHLIANGAHPNDAHFEPEPKYHLSC